ncbi:transmembrane protein [Cystoisospora suis]|uniref:Transmembrane protein n=1 Tax=Cystoisospora suis TaxID=483139 RepID=A0A2C6KVN2_9APIC|nr:transmembrane protein [Cystoisospora suis]
MRMQWFLLRHAYFIKGEDFAVAVALLDLALYVLVGTDSLPFLTQSRDKAIFGLVSSALLFIVALCGFVVVRMFRTSKYKVETYIMPVLLIFNIASVFYMHLINKLVGFMTLQLPVLIFLVTGYPYVWLVAFVVVGMGAGLIAQSVVCSIALGCACPSHLWVDVGLYCLQIVSGSVAYFTIYELGILIVRYKRHPARYLDAFSDLTALDTIVFSPVFGLGGETARQAQASQMLNSEKPHLDGLTFLRSASQVSQNTNRLVSRDYYHTGTSVPAATLAGGPASCGFYGHPAGVSGLDSHGHWRSNIQGTATHTGGGFSGSLGHGRAGGSTVTGSVAAIREPSRAGSARLVNTAREDSVKAHLTPHGEEGSVHSDSRIPDREKAEQDGRTSACSGVSAVGVRDSTGQQRGDEAKTGSSGGGGRGRGGQLANVLRGFGSKCSSTFSVKGSGGSSFFVRGEGSGSNLAVNCAAADNLHGGDNGGGDGASQRSSLLQSGSAVPSVGAGDRSGSPASKPSVRDEGVGRTGSPFAGEMGTSGETSALSPATGEVLLSESYMHRAMPPPSTPGGNRRKSEGADMVGEEWPGSDIASEVSSCVWCLHRDMRDVQRESCASWRCDRGAASDRSSRAAWSTRTWGRYSKGSGDFPRRMEALPLQTYSRGSDTQAEPSQDCTGHVSAQGGATCGAVGGDQGTEEAVSLETRVQRALHYHRRWFYQQLHYFERAKKHRQRLRNGERRTQGDGSREEGGFTRNTQQAMPFSRTSRRRRLQRRDRPGSIQNLRDSGSGSERFRSLYPSSAEEGSHAELEGSSSESEDSENGGRRVRRSSSLPHAGVGQFGPERFRDSSDWRGSYVAACQGSTGSCSFTASGYGGGGCFSAQRNRRLDYGGGRRDGKHSRRSRAQRLMLQSGREGSSCRCADTHGAAPVDRDFSPSCISSSCYSSSSDTRSSGRSSEEDQGSRKSSLTRRQACGDSYAWRRSPFSRRRHRSKEDSTPSDSEHTESESYRDALPRVRKKSSAGYVTVNLVPSLPSRVFFDTFLNSVRRARELSRREGAEEVLDSGNEDETGKETPGAATDARRPPERASASSKSAGSRGERGLLEKYYSFVLPRLPPFPNAAPVLLEAPTGKEEHTACSPLSGKAGVTGSCSSPLSVSVHPASAVGFPQTGQDDVRFPRCPGSPEGSYVFSRSSGGHSGLSVHGSSPSRRGEPCSAVHGRSVSSPFLHRSTVAHCPQPTLLHCSSTSAAVSRPAMSSVVSSQLSVQTSSSCSSFSSQTACRSPPSPVIKKARSGLGNGLMSTEPNSVVYDSLVACDETRHTSGNAEIYSRSSLAEKAVLYGRAVPDACSSELDRSEPKVCPEVGQGGASRRSQRGRGLPGVVTSENNECSSCCGDVSPRRALAPVCIQHPTISPSCSSDCAWETGEEDKVVKCHESGGFCWQASGWHNSGERADRRTGKGESSWSVSLLGEDLTARRRRKKRKSRQKRSIPRNSESRISSKDERRLTESDADSNSSLEEDYGERSKSAIGGVCTLSPIAVDESIDDDSVLLSPLLRSEGEEEEGRDSQSDQDNVSTGTESDRRGSWLSSWLLLWRGKGRDIERTKTERRRRCREMRPRKTNSRGLSGKYDSMSQNGDQLVGGWCDARDVSSVGNVSCSYLRRRMKAACGPFELERAHSSSAYASSSTFSLSVEGREIEPEQTVKYALTGVPSSPPAESLIGEEDVSVGEGQSWSVPQWEGLGRRRGGGKEVEGGCGEQTRVSLSATLTAAPPALSPRGFSGGVISSAVPAAVAFRQRKETGEQRATRVTVVPSLSHRARPSSSGEDNHSPSCSDISAPPQKRSRCACSPSAAVLPSSRRAVFLSDELHQTEGPSESPRQRLDAAVDLQGSSVLDVSGGRDEGDRGTAPSHVGAQTNQAYTSEDRIPTDTGPGQASGASSQDADSGAEGGEMPGRLPSFPHHSQNDIPSGASSVGPHSGLPNRQVTVASSQRGNDAGMAADAGGGPLPRLSSAGGVLARGGGGGTEQPGRMGYHGRGGAERFSVDARHSTARRGRSRGRASNVRSSSKAKHDKSKMLRYHLVQKFHDRLPWWVARIIVYADAALENCRRRRRLMQRATWKTKVAMPVRNMLGLFSDEKIETWYVQWLNAFNAKYYPRVAWLLLLVCVYATAFHGLMRVRSFVENYTICRDAVRTSRLGEAGFIALLAVRFASQPILSLLLMLPVLRHTGSKLIECITCSGSPTTPLKSYKLYRWMLALSILQFAFAVFDNTWHLILNPSSRYINPLTLIPASTSLEVAIVQAALLLAVRAPTITILFLFYLIVYLLVFFLVLPPGARQIQLFTVSLAGWLFTCLGAQIFYTRAFEVNRRRVFCKYVLPYMLYLEEIAAILYSTPQGDLPDDFSDDDVSLVSGNPNECGLQQGNYSY